MKIARWEHDGIVSEGFVVDDVVVPFANGRTVADALEAGLAQMPAWAAEAGTAGRALADVTLLTPVVPAAIRDFVAFEEHVEGVSASVDGKSGVVPEWYEAPTFYFTNPHTVRATGDVIAVPQTQRLDFELELAAVIGHVEGSDGQNLTIEAAAAHVFGYTVMNDWSARDLQAREMKVRLGPAKGKDFGLTLGPWIVTADEFSTDADGFLTGRAEVFVNGELVGRDSMANMGWPFPELIAYAARNSIIVPGDVLGSGTVGNGGCLGELWGLGRQIPALQTGDEVRMSIEGVGEIVNIVGAQVAAPSIPRARRRPRNR